jgi:DNA-binding MltR family transcriptional regulator
MHRTPITEKSVNELVAQLLSLNRQTHTGMVIAASAKIENVLEKLLVVYMRSLTRKEHTRLFGGYGPLSSFSAKTDVAYALNMIPESMFVALNILRRLRNEMAHSEEIVDLIHLKIKPIFDELANLEPKISTADEDVFQDCAYSIGVSLGGYISELTRRRDAGGPPPGVMPGWSAWSVPKSPKQA